MKRAGWLKIRKRHLRRLQAIEEGLWVTAKGVEIPIKELEDSHLANILNMHDRKAAPFKKPDEAAKLIKPLVEEFLRRVS